MLWCRHKQAGPIGETSSLDSIVGMPDIELYWCPRCGAIGRRLSGQKHVMWIKPGRLTVCPRVPGE